MKATPLVRLREQVQCLRDCARHLAGLAPQIPEDSETIALIAANLSVIADNAANLLALHSAEETAKIIAVDPPEKPAKFKSA